MDGGRRCCKFCAQQIPEILGEMSYSKRLLGETARRRDDETRRRDETARRDGETRQRDGETAESPGLQK